tara:strand:- start:61 stop:1191 length:1131 start_codon:yes stop_codon:yes gene_type:complete
VYIPFSGIILNNSEILKTRPKLTINLCALANNYNLLVNRANQSICGAVVKANAYGLGVKEIADCLYQNGCRHYFVANIHEAIELRELFNNIDIFIFDGMMPGQASLIINKNLIPVLNSLDQINYWLNESLDHDHPIAIHFDTGMTRLGLDEKDVIKLSKNKSINNKLAVSFIFTHLSCSSDPSNINNDKQLDLFNKQLDLFPKVRTSVGSSATILSRPDLLGDLARPGISLYGATPFSSAVDNPMEKVFTLTAPIIQIKKIEKGTSVGYGQSTKVSSNSTIATIAIGYADGIPFSMSNNGYCFFKNKKIPVIGRVSMDLITLDVSSILDKDLYVGAEVEIFGSNIDLDTVAKSLGTINYQILTNLSSRIKRVYVNK